MAKSGSRLAQSEILEIRKFTGNKGGRFTIEQNELFARSFEAYLRRGVAPNSQLKSVFEKFKEWLMNVYESVSQLNVNMTPEVIDFFDNYITLEVEENVKSNNEKLQKIENVNKKVKELKETLYQNKDITEAEVEEEVMKRLRSDMEAVEKLKTELPSDLQKEVESNDISKMNRIQFLQNQVNALENKDMKKYRKDLINLLDKSGLEEGYKKEILPILNTMEKSEDFVIVKPRLEKMINDYMSKQIQNTYSRKIYQAIQYSKDLPPESFALFKDLREYNGLRPNEASEKYKELINTIPYVELNTNENMLRTKFLIYKSQGIFADSEIMQEVYNLVNLFKDKKELVKQYKGVLPSEVNSVKKRLNDLIGNSGLRSEYIGKLLTISNMINNEKQFDESIGHFKKMIEGYQESQHVIDTYNKIKDELKFTKDLKRGNITVGKYLYDDNVLFKSLREYNTLTREQAYLKWEELQNTTLSDKKSTKDFGIRARFLWFKSLGVAEVSSQLMDQVYFDITELKEKAKNDREYSSEYLKAVNIAEKQELIDILKNKQEHIKGVKNFYINTYGGSFSNIAFN